MQHEQTSVLKRFGKFLKSGLSLFAKAFRATYHQIWVSGIILLLVTVVFAIALFFAEHWACTDYSFWDALVWTFVKYVEDPADIVSPPVTVLGQIIGTLVGVLGIAIFAVPAGLIGSGLMEAMDEEKHEKQLEEYHGRMRKAFRREVSKSLRAYLNTLPDKGGKALARLNFVPQFVPVSRLQIRQGMEVKDVFEVCRKYPEFRLKNLAEALTEEDRPEDRFVLSTMPLNTSYGCCIDRGSKVTIVCPVGFSEVGTGWFCYYMAKLGGFNFVCKDLEVDADELDSYFNMTEEPLYDKKPRKEYKSKDKLALKVLDEKVRMRTNYLADIKRVANRDGAWLIMVSAHLQSSENKVDFHFAHTKKDGTCSTIEDSETFDRFYTRFSEEMQQDLGLSSVKESARFPLVSKNLLYRLQNKEGVRCNAFVFRPSANLMIFDIKKLLYAYRVAHIMSEMLDDGKGVVESDVIDLSSTIFGFMENSNLGTN